MAKVNLERRAEIGREKRARTKAQLVTAAKALFSQRPWESVTIDEVVNEAGVAKGTFYGHFNDLDELAAAVADELVQSFDELIQPQRLSIADPLVRIAFGCDAFMKKAWKTARGPRSWPGWRDPIRQLAKSRGAGSRKTCALRSSDRRRRNCRWTLRLEVAFGVVVQVAAAIGEGRLEDRDRPEVVRCILTALGVGKRDDASIAAQIARLSRSAARSRRRDADEPRLTTRQQAVQPRSSERGRHGPNLSLSLFAVVQRVNLKSVALLRHASATTSVCCSPRSRRPSVLKMRAADAVAGSEVLRSAALRLEEQLPELALGQQLDDAANRGRRHAQRAAAGRASEQHVALARYWRRSTVPRSSRRV